MLFRHPQVINATTIVGLDVGKRHLCPDLHLEAQVRAGVAEPRLGPRVVRVVHGLNLTGRGEGVVGPGECRVAAIRSNGGCDAGLLDRTHAPEHSPRRTAYHWTIRHRPRSFAGFAAEPRFVPENFAPNAPPFGYPASKSLIPSVWPTVDYEPPSENADMDHEVSELRKSCPTSSNPDPVLKKSS